ncbi:hypothetical protein [Emticicia fontis]
MIPKLENSHQVANLFPIFSQKQGKQILFDESKIEIITNVKLTLENTIGIYTIRSRVAKEKKKDLYPQLQELVKCLKKVDFEYILSIRIEIKEDNSNLNFLIFSNIDLDKNIFTIEF